MEQYSFGVDVGGTTVKIGLFSFLGEEANLLNKWEIPTDVSENGVHILDDISESLKQEIERQKIKKLQIKGIGIGVPGPVDLNGIIHHAVNLGWGEFNLKEELEKRSGLPVVAGNDANLATVGEQWQGAGNGCKDMILITLGTGVGGGIISDRKILYGSKGAAGEIGHLPMNEKETELCGCGHRGCLEQYASARGIARLARRKISLLSNSSSLLQSVPLEKITAKDVVDAYNKGDLPAKEILEEFGEYLGKGLAMISTLTNPSVIVIGGGVSKAGEMLIPFIETKFKEFVFPASKEVEFRMAQLGNDAGIYGGAKIIHDQT